MDIRQGVDRPSAWCLFESSSRHWAVPLENVAEIIAVDRLVRMPLCPPDMLGLCTVRREAIPVFWPIHDEASAGTLTPSHVVLILRVAQGLWGMPIVREGTTVLEEDPGLVGPPPSPARGSSGASASSEGDDDASAIVRGKLRYRRLDPETAWHEARRSIERWYGRGVARPSPAVLPGSV